MDVGSLLRGTFRGWSSSGRAASVDLLILHEKHCSRCAAKTELCVTVIFFEALVSFDSKVFTAYPGSDQLIHSTDLVVDLRWLASFVICASVTPRKGGDSAAGSP